MSEACPGCGSESRYHSAECPIAAKLKSRIDIEAKVQELVGHPEAYRKFLAESMCAHLLALDKAARLGDYRAAASFRTGALEVLETLDAEEVEGQAGGAAAGTADGSGNTRTSGAAAAIAAAMGQASVELADREGHGRKPGDPDEG